MTVHATTHAASGLGAYQNAMRAQRMEQEAARLAQTISASRAQGSVRTRTVGFSLGPFSIDLTTRDLEIQDDPTPETLTRATFSDSLHAATTTPPSTTNDHTLPANKTLARLRALETYAATSLNTATPGHIGTV